MTQVDLWCCRALCVHMAVHALQCSMLLIIFLHKDQYVKKTETPNINTEDKMYMVHNIWGEQLQDRTHVFRP